MSDLRRLQNLRDLLWPFVNEIADGVRLWVIDSRGIFIASTMPNGQLFTSLLFSLQEIDMGLHSYPGELDCRVVEFLSRANPPPIFGNLGRDADHRVGLVALTKTLPRPVDPEKELREKLERSARDAALAKAIARMRG